MGHPRAETRALAGRLARHSRQRPAVASCGEPGPTMPRPGCGGRPRGAKPFIMPGWPGLGGMPICGNWSCCGAGGLLAPDGMPLAPPFRAPLLFGAPFGGSAAPPAKRCGGAPLPPGIAAAAIIGIAPGWP